MDFVMQSILDTVSKITEISSENILSNSKRQDYVLARKLFTNFCIEYGFSTTAVANQMHKTNRGIRRLYTESLSDDYRTIYRIFHEKIKTELGSKDTLNK